MRQGFQLPCRLDHTIYRKLRSSRILCLGHLFVRVMPQPYAMINGSSSHAEVRCSPQRFLPDPNHWARLSDRIAYDLVALTRSRPRGRCGQKCPMTLNLFQIPPQKRDLVFSILGQEVKLEGNVTVVSVHIPYVKNEHNSSCTVQYSKSYSDGDSFGAQRLATVK